MSADRQDLEVFDRNLTRGLRELDGLETPPDIAERVLSGAATRVGQQRAPLRALAAAVVVVMGLAVALAVRMTGFGDSETVPGVSQQGRTQQGGLQEGRPLLPPPVTIRAARVVGEYPVTTENAICHGFAAKEIRLLRRFPKLRGLTLRGYEFDPAVLRELARLDKLEMVVIDVEMAASHVGSLRALRSLPQLRMVGVSLAKIDDAVLRALVVSKQITAVSLRGVIDCSPAGMLRFGRDLPRLRSLSIAPLPPQDLGGLARLPPRVAAVDHDVWDALPATLVALSLRRQNPPVKSLRRLPGLKVLDLFECWEVGRELLQATSTWPGCRIVTPIGAHLRVDAKGACHPAPQSVVLEQRMKNGPYRSAGYSFRYVAGSVARHWNEVDLLFDGCGYLYCNAFGGCENRLLELGRDGRVPALDQLPDAGWEHDSIWPRVGRHYLLHVKHADEGQMFVRFEITKIEGKHLHLTWQHLDAGQAFAMAPRPNRGRAGTKGMSQRPRKGN